ncbi:MAG: M23 family metallopeptidase [Gemmatimonadaceae bacterium]|nr:M23 family metallopeptidase [Gemmatimonadaceae bacterium]
MLAACSRGRPESAPRPTPAPVETTPWLGPTPAHTGPRSEAITDDDLAELWRRQIMIPVEGVSRLALRDNYTAGRSNGKIHGALDILAPKGTPVMAAADHVIGRLFEGPIGGIVIYAYDDASQFVYYYAHLDRYRRGLAVGDRVAKGSVIGYVGTTGNAPPDTPHLHFQVMKRGRGRAWWDGPAINPFSYFAFDGIRP